MSSWALDSVHSPRLFLDCLPRSSFEDERSPLEERYLPVAVAGKEMTSHINPSVLL